jgi:hypothetical protein
MHLMVLKKRVGLLFFTIVMSFAVMFAEKYRAGCERF